MPYSDLVFSGGDFGEDEIAGGISNARAWMIANKDMCCHHSIAVTVDIYRHLMPGGNKATVDKLDDERPSTVQPSATLPQPENAQAR